MSTVTVLKEFSHRAVHFARKYSNLFIKHKLEASPFCKLSVVSSLPVRIKSLDLQDYPNCDKVLVDLSKGSADSTADIKWENSPSGVSVIASGLDGMCTIQAPIRAEIDVTASEAASIQLSNFHGELIECKTDRGNVTVEQCQAEKILLKSTSGCIETKKLLQGKQIEITTGDEGTITTDRLQGIRAKLTSKNGNIYVKCCYCDESDVETENGALMLVNVHKKCNVNVLKDGSVNIIGFDGTLSAALSGGKFQVHAARLQGESTIRSSGSCFGCLKLSDEVQDTTCLDIRGATLLVDDLVHMERLDEGPGGARLLPLRGQPAARLRFDCATASYISLEHASWHQMMTMFKAK